jgi:TorA maturation chaperone TorD
MQDHQDLAPLYGLLSRVLAHELDEELVKTLAQPPVAQLLEPAAPGLSDYLAAFDDDAKEAADEEFCALFLLPGGVPPRAAAWIEGELETVGANISRAAQAQLDATGRDVATGPWGKLPLDHLSLLLSLASEGDREVADHLVKPWAADFGRALSARASCPVYRATGEVLCAL